MRTLSSADIDEIKRRTAGTTPGIWREGKIPGTIVADPDLLTDQAGVTQEVLDRYGGIPVASDVGEADRQFIIHAREDIKRLLEEREVLLNRIAELEEQRWPGSRG